MLCKNNLIANLKNIDGSRCNGNPEDIQLLFAGANGFALKFICNNGLIYTIELVFEFQQTFAGRITTTYKKAYEKNKIIIDSITNSYDLYSLSKSFLEQFDIDKKSIFYNILNEAIHEIILSE